MVIVLGTLGESLQPTIDYQLLTTNLEEPKMKDDDVMNDEELFEEIDLMPKNSLPVARKRLKKAKKDIFAGIKVKMVMRIYGVSRARALEIIAGRAAEKKALEDAKEKKGKKERNNAGKFLSAEEFFG